jgi:hypothetical protein
MKEITGGCSVACNNAQGISAVKFQFAPELLALNLAPRFRISGALPLLPLHAFMAWSGTTLYLYLCFMKHHFFHCHTILICSRNYLLNVAVLCLTTDNIRADRRRHCLF